MIWSTLSRSGRTGKSKVISSAVLLSITALCLLLLDTLINSHSSITEAERDARNSSASTLYVNLATLAQPVTTSDITRTLLAFIRDDRRIKGTTLLDAQGQLIAQLGGGNDSLSLSPGDSPTARIPISSAGELYGHAVVAYQPAKDRMNVAFHYIVLTSLSMTLAFLLIGLLRIHLPIARTGVKQPSFSWQQNSSG